MKQNSLEHLLAKYREGTLCDEERAELESLAHKDEVTAVARRRAKAVVRRRVSLAFAAAMVVGAGVVVVLPHDVAQQPLVAEVQELPAAVQEESPLVEEAILPAVAKAPHPAEAVAMRPSVSRPSVKKQSPADEPVVVCNSQCDADSVISDIRKFLSV